jgi:hypothetical protein
MRENTWPLFSCVTLLNMIISSSIYLLQTTFYSSLCLNNTPLCIYTTFSLSIFLIHSGHLGCFHSLAIVNSAVVSKCASVSIVSLLTFFQIYAQEMCFRITCYFLVFWGTSIVLSIVLALITFPPTEYTFPAPTSLAVSVVLCVLDESCSGWSEWKSQCHFDLYFLCPGTLNISSCIYWLLVLFLLKIICSVPLPIYQLGYWFFGSLIFELHIYSSY